MTARKIEREKEKESVGFHFSEEDPSFPEVFQDFMILFVVYPHC